LNLLQICDIRNRINTAVVVQLMFTLHQIVLMGDWLIFTYDFSEHVVMCCCCFCFYYYYYYYYYYYIYKIVIILLLTN